MPEKQTRESIEAELNASEQDRLMHKLQNVLRDWDEMEVDLQSLERQRGLPDTQRWKPLPERYEALGMDHAAKAARVILDAMQKVRIGRKDEISEPARRILSEQADAEISAMDQLQNILDAKRR